MIRTLRDDEPIPDGEPSRYLNALGYVRLRWRIGRDQYVEQYEHRIIAGRPPAHLDVHHRDGDKSNNDPSNLEVLTKDEHTRRHAELEEAARPKVLRFGGYRCAQAQMKAERRLAREKERSVRVAEIRRMRAEGMTTVEIAALLGIHHSGISRYAVHGHQ